MTAPTSQSRTGFSLIELLASIAILVLLTTIVFGIFNQASRAWLLGESRTETFQNARLAIEMIAREIEGAMVASNASTGRRITFLTFENANTVPGGASGLVATPPNDQIFFVAKEADTASQTHVDLFEYGYMVVFAQNDAETMKAGQYYLLRHKIDSGNPATWDFFAQPTSWHTTPPVGTAVKTPILDNVLRFELRYERFEGPPPPQGTIVQEAWPSNDTLPRAVHIRLSVLDRRYAAALSAITGGNPLASGELAKVPYDMGAISPPALTNFFPHAVRTFFRTVYPRNAS